MGQVLGADPDQLDGLAQVFSASAERIDAIRGEVAGVLSYTQWEGGDADDFRWLWNSQLAGSLHGVAAVLRVGDTKLRGNAEQQRHASGADTGAGGHRAEFLAGGSWGARPAVGFDIGAAVAGAAGVAWDALTGAASFADLVKDVRGSHVPRLKKAAEALVGLTGHLGKAGAAVRELGGTLAKWAKPLEIADTAKDVFEFGTEVAQDWRSTAAFDKGVGLAFSAAGIAVGLAFGAPVAIPVGLALVGGQFLYDEVMVKNPELHESLHQGAVRLGEQIGTTFAETGNAIRDGADAAVRVISGGVDSLLNAF